MDNSRGDTAVRILPRRYRDLEKANGQIRKAAAGVHALRQEHRRLLLPLNTKNTGANKHTPVEKIKMLLSVDLGNVRSAKNVVDTDVIEFR